MLEIAQDKGAPPGVRAKLAIRLAEGAGLFKDRPDGSANPRKSLSEMTREELDEVVKQGAAVLQAAGRVGKTIEGRVTPNNTPENNTESVEALSDKA